MRRLLLICTLGLAILGDTARGADSDWLTVVFPERAYDFGTVARGSQVRHSFPIVNRTNSEIRIATWRTKCGCTNVRVGARVIPPGTQTTVEATIDTTKFQGPKASGLTLVIDQPSFVELDLNLTCFIRADITLAPGQIDFGILRRGEPPLGGSYGHLCGGAAELGDRRNENRNRQGQGRGQGNQPHG